MDWGRALAAILIAALINMQLVAAGLWPPETLVYELAELAPQTLNPQIYEIFSEEQVQWMLKVWNGPNKYIITDRYGRLWTVGQGSTPEPLRAALYNMSIDKWLLANAASSVGWVGWYVRYSEQVGSGTATERWYVHPKYPLLNLAQGQEYCVVDSDVLFTSNSPEGGNWYTPKCYNASLALPYYAALQSKTVYFGDTNYLVYRETSSGTIVQWIVKITAVNSQIPIPAPVPLSGLGVGFIFRNGAPLPLDATCTIKGTNGVWQSNITREDGLYWDALYCNASIPATTPYIILNLTMKWPNYTGDTTLEIGQPPESQPPEPPPPGELPEDKVNRTECVITPLDGSSLPIIQSGQIGGNGGETVEWIIAKNLDSPNWPANTTDLDDYWRAAVGWSWSTVEPRTCDFSFYTASGSELDLIDESFTFDWGSWPAFRHSDILPDDAGQYVYIWMVRLDTNYTRYIWVAYTNTTINAQGEGNKLVRALKNAFSSAISAFLALLKKLLPDELEQLAGYAWQYFKQVKDLFTQMFNYVPWLADILRLLIFLMPAVIVAILIYDPFRLIDFFRFIFRMLLEVVQFIRSLLPI